MNNDIPKLYQATVGFPTSIEADEIKTSQKETQLSSVTYCTNTKGQRYSELCKKNVLKLKDATCLQAVDDFHQSGMKLNYLYL